MLPSSGTGGRHSTYRKKGGAEEVTAQTEGGRTLRCAQVPRPRNFAGLFMPPWGAAQDGPAVAWLLAVGGSPQRGSSDSKSDLGALCRGSLLAAAGPVGAP